MRKIAIVTDGSCDIPRNLIEKFRIYVIPFKVIFGEEVYITKGDWGTLTKEEFYEKVKTSEDFPTTGIPSQNDISKVFQEALLDAESVICILLSKNFSGLFNEALKVSKSFDDSDITLIDSTMATSSLGVLVLQAAKMVEKGYTKEELLREIEELKLQTRLFVILDNIEGVYRSGRVGWIKKSLVSSLNIKPMAIMKDGKAISSGTLIGSKEVAKRLKFIAPIIAEEAISDYIFIWHVRYSELANELCEIMNLNNINNREIIVQEAGPVVGAHLGEKSIGIMYIGNYKKKWVTKMKK